MRILRPHILPAALVGALTPSSVIAQDSADVGKRLIDHDLNANATVVKKTDSQRFLILDRGREHGFVPGRSVCLFNLEKARKICVLIHDANSHQSSVILPPPLRKESFKKASLRPRYRWPDGLHKDDKIPKQEQERLKAAFKERSRSYYSQRKADAEAYDEHLHSTFPTDPEDLPPAMIVKLKKKRGDDKKEKEVTTADLSALRTETGSLFTTESSPKPKSLETAAPEKKKKKKRRKKRKKGRAKKTLDIDFGYVIPMGSVLNYQIVGVQPIGSGQTEADTLLEPLKKVDNATSALSINVKKPIWRGLSVAPGLRFEDFSSPAALSDYDPDQPNLFSISQTEASAWELWVDAYWDIGFAKHFYFGAGLGLGYYSSEVTAKSRIGDEDTTVRQIIAEGESSLDVITIRIPLEMRYRIHGYRPVSIFLRYVVDFPLFAWSEKLKVETGTPTDLTYNGNLAEEFKSGLEHSSALGMAIVVGIGFDPIWILN